MHTFTLLALASSAFALPLLGRSSTGVAGTTGSNGVVTNAAVPVDVSAANIDLSYLNALNDVASNNKIASGKRGGEGFVNSPATGVAGAKNDNGVVTNAAVPVAADILNVDAHDSNIANGVLSNNKVLSSRGYTNVPSLLYALKNDVTNLVIEIENLLSSYPTYQELAALLQQLGSLLSTTAQDILALKGSSYNLYCDDNGVTLSVKDILELVVEILEEVVKLVQAILKVVSYDVSALLAGLAPVIEDLLKALEAVLPPVLKLVVVILGGVVKVLSTLNISITL